MTEERKTGVVQIGNVVYYFVNGLVVGYATVKELGSTTQTMVSVTLEESIEFDDNYTNAKIRGLDKTAYFESHGNNDTEICKKCIHGDNKGGCVTRYESPFNSFGCIKNNQFESIEE